MNPNRWLLGSLIVVTILGVTVTLLPGTSGGCDGKCCKRPTGTPTNTCLRLNPNDGGPEDFGDENTAPASLSIGSGCVATECVWNVGITQ